jgi:hypothetical protein
MLLDLLGAPDGVFGLPEIRRQPTPDEFTCPCGIIRLTIREPDDAATTVAGVLDNRPHVGAKQDVDGVIFEDGGAVSQLTEVAADILFNAA